MRLTTITFLSLSVITSKVASQFCSYNANGRKDGSLDCDQPAENVTGIFVPDGNIILEIKKGLFAPFIKLTGINIGRANVEKIEPGAFDGLSLEYLQLNNNNIKKIENGTLSLLNTTTFFEMTFNQLESLEADTFLGMTSLGWISLSANRIKTVDKAAFNGLEKLKHLFMANNKLESLELDTFDTLVSLTLLDLSENSLKEIKFGLFSQQRRLEKLFLQHNNLEGLPDHLFDNLTTIKTVDVSQNRLRELQENLFYGIENLETLLFYSNNITQFNSRSLLVHVPKLEEVQLHENPWKCEELKRILGDFEIKNVFTPIPIPLHDTANVNGIGCSE